MTNTTPTVDRRLKTKNPARFLLYPIGLICGVLAVLILYSQLFEVRQLSWPNFGAGIVMLAIGILCIWLGCTRYTQLRRFLTVLLGFLSFCAIAISIRVEPPSGMMDTILVTATMSIPTYIWLIALRCRPQPIVTNELPATVGLDSSLSR